MQTQNDLSRKRDRWEIVQALSAFLVATAVQTGAIIGQLNCLRPASRPPMFTPGTVTTIPATSWMSTTRDQEKQDLRIEQMTIKIEKMRAEMKWETRRFVVSAVVASAALPGAGVAIGNYFSSRAPTYPPGTVITIPPAK